MGSPLLRHVGPWCCDDIHLRDGNALKRCCRKQQRSTKGEKGVAPDFGRTYCYSCLGKH
jgi:hypothetical protein